MYASVLVVVVTPVTVIGTVNGRLVVSRSPVAASAVVTLNVSELCPVLPRAGRNCNPARSANGRASPGRSEAPSAMMTSPSWPSGSEVATNTNSDPEPGMTVSAGVNSNEPNPSDVRG